MVDVSDVAEDVKKITGDFTPQMEASTKVNGKYLAVPHDGVPNAVHWRKGWFKDAGAQKFPATFAELFTVGRKLKANGHPMGQALGHSFGDPPTWCYPMLWGYGGREVDEQGKVAINSPETIAAVKAMKDAWKDAYDEPGLSWDDGSNNSAFLADQLSATLNGASIWWKARADKMPMFDDIGLDLIPAGPKGRNVFITNNSYAVMKYSKNVEAAKAFVRWSMSNEVWMPWFEVNASYIERRRRQAGRDRHLEEVPRRYPGLPAGRADHPHARLARPVQPEGGPGAVEVHHRRHVRQGGGWRQPGVGGGLGRGRAEADLHISASYHPGIVSMS